MVDVSQVQHYDITVMAAEDSILWTKNKKVCSPKFLKALKSAYGAEFADDDDSHDNPKVADAHFGTLPLTYAFQPTRAHFFL